MVAPPDEFSWIVGENIRVERTRKGLTQEELAELLDIDEKTVSRHECGKGLTIKSISMYAKEFGCTCAELCAEKANDEGRLLRAYEMTKKLPREQQDRILGFLEYSLSLGKV